nr:methionine--tRNA ligase subunit beta [Deltaproteobacteria bacterium]
ALLLAPVMPGKMVELCGRLGLDRATRAAAGLDLLRTGAPITFGDPLFPRIRELPESLAAAAPAAPTPPRSPSMSEPVVPPNPAVAAPAPAPAPATTTEIVYDDFAKIQLRTGKVMEATKHPNADKLIVLKVDVGEAQPRQILAGIASKFTPEELVGRSVIVVVNLAPRKLRGLESHGMLLAAGGDKGVIELATVADCPPGEVVR